MARQRMVTRTVEVNRYTVMTVNTNTAEVVNTVYTLGAIPANTDPMKLLKKQYETSTIKLCAIVSHTYDTVLYGMPEEEFIAHATILPPRNSND